MITAFRRYLETWVVRGFFLIMVLAFISWGVGDVIRIIGTSTWVAKAGDQTIEGAQLQEAYQRDMSQMTRNLPSGQEPTQEMRSNIARNALQSLISQAALNQELRRLRIATPDQAVRQSVFAIPAFRGPNGQFDQQTFEAVLRNNGLTEQRFLDMMRNDQAQRQLLGALSAGAAPPAGLLDPLYEGQFEKRSADMVEFPIAAAAQSPTPTEAELRRWYDNHPDLYSAPEYRRIKAIELTPQALGKDIPVTDADLQAAYDRRRSDYAQPAKRSVDVVSVPDEAKANELTAKWHDGADWPTMQKAAQDAGGSAIELNDATERDLPDPDLAKMVFAAAPNTIAGPAKSGPGWHIIRVTKITPGSDRSLTDVKDELRNQVLASKAADLMYDRANKVDNILGTGASLDQMPDDLGLVGVAGSLDAEGNTPSGTPAPIPGPVELKSAIIKAAFETQKGDPPRLIEVQTPSTGGSAYYALSVEDVTPPAVKPFDTVKDQATADRTHDVERHSEEQAAAKVLTAVKGGQSIADAAAVAGVTVRRTPLVTRGGSSDGMPAQLVQPLFSLKQGEPTMVETGDGFIVAVVAETVKADPKSDPAGYNQVREAVTRSVANDIVATFADALRERAQPRVNQPVLDNIIGQQP